MMTPNMRRTFGLFACTLMCLMAIQGCSNSNSSSSAGGTTGTQANGGSTDTEAKGSTDPTADAIPQSLKHEGFNYYGLANTQPEQMVVTGMPGSEGNASPTGELGEQTAKFEKMDGNNAIFIVTRTDALRTIGSDTVSVQNDGVFVIQNSEGKFSKPALALPAKLEIGKVWAMKDTFTTNGGLQLDYDVKQKIEKREKVQVKAGSFDAILISSAGTVTDHAPTMDGKPGKPNKMNLNSKSWYVAGKGLVKSTLELSGPTRKQTVMIELSK